MKQIKEEKVCTFTQPGCRLQLVMLYMPSDKAYYHYKTNSYDYYYELYELRLNRKVLGRYESIYLGKKAFVAKVSDIMLQLTIE